MISRILQGLSRRLLRACTHAEQIEGLLREARGGGVLVETGSGLSTLALARAGRPVISCDYNEDKIEELKHLSGLSVEFMLGDSLESLKKVAAKHEQIDFLFLDSAASAMHTFREFMIVEDCLKPGAIVLVDNAVVPGYWGPTFSPARKGKILIPYLLGSPYWNVCGRPLSGDSMVSATLRAEPDYADPRYEDQGYIDNWRQHFSEAMNDRTKPRNTQG